MTCWTNWVMRKIEPNVPKYMKNETPFVTANARSAKRSSGSIGCGGAALVGDEGGEQERRPRPGSRR